MIPEWLHFLAWASLIVGWLCAAIIILDEVRRPQHMWIMNIVWPATALFGSVGALYAYLKVGVLGSRPVVRGAKDRGETPPHKEKPFWQMVGVGATHCGSGCALGDLCAEWLVFGVPVVATWFGYRAIFEHKIFAVWVVDYILAFLFGIAFQYFTIKPMRGLSVGKGLWQAVKADTLSLTSWQVGMYGFMAVAHFWIFKQVLNHELKTNTPEFWFMMQIAMLFGFATAYPVNWWLLRRGIKEKM